MSGWDNSAEIMRMMVASSFQATQVKMEYGELTAYDPATYTAEFELPMVLDENDNPQHTGFIPIGTMLAGTSFGMQFTPVEGMQALILFMDHRGFSPVAAVFLANQVNPPPFPDGKTQGWLDSQGSSITTTIDGSTPGDGVGAARVFGKAYTAATTTLGHSFTQDDVLRQVKQSTAGGFYTLYDDVGRAISHVTPGGITHLLDDSTGEMASLALAIGLGDRIANLGAGTAASRFDDLQTLSNNLIATTVQSFAAIFSSAMITAGVPNSPALAAIVTATNWVVSHISFPTIPGCSAITRTK